MLEQRVAFKKQSRIWLIIGIVLLFIFGSLSIISRDWEYVKVASPVILIAVNLSIAGWLLDEDGNWRFE